VTGLGIRLFTDEMINPALARALRTQGYDIESCEEAGRSRQDLSDDQQLAYATQHGRAILTFDVEDYYRLDQRWKAAGRRHHGIIVSPEVADIGRLIRRVKRHLDYVTSGEQADTLLWLRPGTTR